MAGIISLLPGVFPTLYREVHIRGLTLAPIIWNLLGLWCTAPGMVINHPLTLLLFILKMTVMVKFTSPPPNSPFQSLNLVHYADSHLATGEFQTFCVDYMLCNMRELLLNLF